MGLAEGGAAGGVAMQQMTLGSSGQACLVQRAAASPSSVSCSWNVQYARNNPTGGSIIGNLIHRKLGTEQSLHNGPGRVV